jgi:hypothetical protein
MINFNIVRITKKKIGAKLKQTGEQNQDGRQA